MGIALLEDKVSEPAQYQLLDKTECFYFIRAIEEKVQLAWTFYQLLANDGVKVIKAKRIVVWILMQLISQSER